MVPAAAWQFRKHLDSGLKHMLCVLGMVLCKARSDNNVDSELGDEKRGFQWSSRQLLDLQYPEKPFLGAGNSLGVL